MRSNTLPSQKNTVLAMGKHTDSNTNNNTASILSPQAASNARFIKSITFNKLNSYNALITNRAFMSYTSSEGRTKKNANINGKGSKVSAGSVEASGSSITARMVNEDVSKLPYRTSLKQINTDAVNHRPLTVGMYRQDPLNNDSSIGSNLPPISKLKKGMSGTSREKSFSRLSSSNLKNRNFISFLHASQQNEEHRLKTQINKMCSISFKRLDNSNENNNMKEFTNKFENLDLITSPNNSSNNEDSSDYYDLKKMSILNNYFSNSSSSKNRLNNTNTTISSNKSENDADTPTTTNSNAQTYRKSYFTQRPDSLLSVISKSECYDDMLNEDENDDDHYYDM